MITVKKSVTRSSIKALYKLCYSGGYFNSIKVAPLCKHLSTATETYPYYQAQVGNDSELDSRGQNRVGSGGGGGWGLNSVNGSQRLANEVNYGGNGDKGNTNVSGSGSFEGKNTADRYAQSVDRNVGENGLNLGGYGVGEYKQMWDGYKWSNEKKQYPKTDMNYRGGDGGHLWNGNVGQFSGIKGGENGGAHNPGSGNVLNYQSGGHQVASGNGGYANNFQQYQQGNYNNYGQSNYGQYQGVDNRNYAYSAGAHQNTATQQNGNFGSHTVNQQYQYQGSNAGVYQQNPYNLIYNRNAVTGQMQSNSTSPYPNTSSQVTGSSNMEGNSTDALEVPQIRGTIEELEQYSKDGKLKEALEVLELLEKNQQRLVPERDTPTVVMLMDACGEAKADKEAKVVHNALMKLMNPLTVSTYNKILDMYLKCGSFEEAYSLFNEIPNGDVTSWDTMIRGLVKNDLGEEAIDIFTEFKNTELKPDGRIFLGVFSACGIVGDVTEGMLHFQSMSNQYGITPSMEHYVGMVEMLGHAGYLDNALEFIENMPVKPSVDVWEMLMHVSRIQGNVELGDRCADLVEKLDPSRLQEQSKAGLIPLKASDLEKEKERKKLASKNLLEVRSRVHEYRAGDTSHPENDRIYALLRGLKTQMKEAGYIPELRGVLHDIDPEGKEEALLAHSERLAAAYGFLTTAARQPIRVIKNLRVCVDCHNALKIISNLVGRELIMRDAKRFHHFKDGVCSCKDYW